MPFDGMTIHILTDEIKNIILDSKVDKIHQPEQDEIVLHLRKDRKTYKLLLSADSNLPYFSLTELKKENPIQAPMFCMLLRKHLSGGRVIDIEQLELERVLTITIEAREELGDIKKKRLIFEIMGKHSNLTLVDENDKIIDCIKRIALGVNRYRQLFPGITYLFPPNDKQDPRYITHEQFKENLKLEGRPLFKHIYMTYQGISPVIAKEICKMSEIDFNESNLKINDSTLLYQNFVKTIDLINKPKPQVIYLENKAIKDLTFMDLSPYDQLGKQFFNSVIHMVNEYYANKNTVNKLLQRSHDLRKSIQSKIDRLNKKLQNLEEDLLYAETAEKFKIKGDLILSNLYRIEKGMKSVVLENFYDDMNAIKIDLDYKLSPSDNAQKFFKRYNKLKTAQIKVMEQIEKTYHEIDYLEHVIHNLEQSADSANIEEIKEELTLSGYLRRKVSKQKKKTKSLPYHYISSDGFDIFVGKNNLQNDQLTLKTSSKYDLWFHTKDIPGSHVIVKTENQEVPKSTLEEAALIAAYHSKAKDSSLVPVDYTPIRNIKKPNGAKPGMVIFSTNQTVYVTPVEEKILGLRYKK